MLFKLLVISIALNAQVEQWPGFLGQGATRISQDTIPVSWSPEENLAWSQELEGYGQSSPVIYGENIYTTAVSGENKETLLLTCLSMKGGQQKWSYSTASSLPLKSSVYVSRAAPTPVVDSKGVYAYFESGDVIAQSHAGKLLWKQSLTELYGPPENEFGLSASPVQYQNTLIILIDDAGPSYLVGLDKQSGKVIWKSDRKSRRSWSSPSLITIEDQPQVVCSSDGSIDGYDPLTGQLLWSWTDVGGNTGTTPLTAGKSRFLIAASPGREGENSELARKSNGVMQVSKINETWQPEFRWTDPSPVPSWASPFVHNGLAYWINRAGVLYCLDAETGESIYTERLAQSAWATPVGIGDRIYVFGRDGLTIVIKAGREFEVLSENSLWTEDSPPVNNTPTAEEETEERRRAAVMFSRPTVYGVAIVNGSILLRTGSKLFCIRNES
ncbi:MAG TPA: pyrrolo-quinoline quinone [Planctomycetaceae bacterium]|mgnify:CR=1 FL=1|nr:pyrrolo-quinoline quinone [Planctomycetaceae bacterium]